MGRLIIIFIHYLVKAALFILIAFAGIYIGYRLNHGFEIYFEKQKRQIDRYGKLIAYMNRHYKAVNSKNRMRGKIEKRKEEWLYVKCYNYAEKCDKYEINIAKAHIKSDIKICEAMSLLITVFVGLSNFVINMYAYNISVFIIETSMIAGLANDNNRVFQKLSSYFQNFIGLIFLLLLIFVVKKFSIILRKQQYFLCILEDLNKQ